MIVFSSAGERAHDARRPSGGSLKSHPVVGGIALTPRYSPRPRLDHIRPAAAPPENPVDYEPAPTPGPDVEPRLGALLGAPPTSQRTDRLSTQAVSASTAQVATRLFTQAVSAQTSHISTPSSPHSPTRLLTESVRASIVSQFPKQLSTQTVSAPTTSLDLMQLSSKFVDPPMTLDRKRLSTQPVSAPPTILNPKRLPTQAVSAPMTQGSSLLSTETESTGLSWTFHPAHSSGASEVNAQTRYAEARCENKEFNIDKSMVTHDGRIVTGCEIVNTRDFKCSFLKFIGERNLKDKYVGNRLLLSYECRRYDN